MCLTGPAATFLLLGPDGDGIRQVLGPGDCSDTESIDAEADGDVVVDITFEIVGKRLDSCGTSRPSRRARTSPTRSRASTTSSKA